MTRGRARITHDTEALVLRRVEYGDADLIVTLFTRSQGKVSALARGARKSQRRFGGALEPFFTIRTRLEERTDLELFALVHAEIFRPRGELVSDLSRMELAGRALSWIRLTAPPRTAEPVVFDRIERLLDRLAERDTTSPELELAEAGLCLLSTLGWALEFERCVRCSRACPPNSPATINVQAGGLVCRSCGGARIRITAEQRARFSSAAGGRSAALAPEDTTLALNLIDRVFTAHAGIEPRG